MTCKYGSHYSPLNNTRSHEIYGWSRACAGLGVVRVHGPWEVRLKSPKCFGHMKLLSSSRALYGSKTREPVGNPWTCRASPQDFSKILDPYGRHRPVAENRACTTFRHGLPTILGPWNARRQSYGFSIGSHTGHRHMSHIRALKCPVWVLTAPYGSAFKTTRILRYPYGPHTSTYDCLRSVCMYTGSQARKASRSGPYGDNTCTLWNP